MRPDTPPQKIKEWMGASYAAEAVENRGRSLLALANFYHAAGLYGER
jgi:hypothetical protein